MSSWADIKLDGQTILTTQNHFSTWFFRNKERVIEKNPTTGDTLYKYVMSGETLRRRLELDGHNMASLQREFNKQLAQMKSDCEEMIDIDSDGKTKELLPILAESTLADWLQRLRKIVEQKLERIHFGEVDKEFGDTLLNFMMSADGYYFSDNPGAGDYNFPCQTYEGYAIALLEVLPKNIECVLDISELIAGGWTNAFDDLVEFKQDFTTFYGIFKASLEDISALTQIAPDNKTLARMLYAAVISAMETYLSDTLRKQVFVKPAIKRRFVEAHGKFKGNHLDLSDIYTWLEKLDSFITDVIDSESFHNIVSVNKLYKNVLLTDIPKLHMDKLVKAIAIRHDIVHRNGKTLDGIIHQLTMDEVHQLVLDVDAAIQHIDKQIKDGLLDDLDEEDL
ncbi:HEPN/Toprim-associated domain-containing protein [Serratia marcescens]|uniref:HEPN/Toprim-associated domain-containing protein n=1 Tax=Serratia marcescens TaxID=615 RepID=UPI0039BF4377